MLSFAAAAVRRLGSEATGSCRAFACGRWTGSAGARADPSSGPPNGSGLWPARRQAPVGPGGLADLIHHWSVTRGLDPRVHPLRKRMDCRVKPGKDAEFVQLDRNLPIRSDRKVL